ncbi:hypothetical protein [Pseudomonas syringae]
MTNAKERPILFSAPMVRAILEGRKTVTRRVVKDWQAPSEDCSEADPDFRWSAIAQKHPRYGFLVCGSNAEECADKLASAGVCPYGRRGERLWVRETHADIGCRLTYRADTDDGAHCQVKKWTPAIHMFRQHSRILLEITEVRVERLQAVSRGDIRAEGVECPPELASDDVSPNYRDWYPAAWRELWESINGAGAWDANPWVWVVEFKRVRAAEDQVG